MNKWIAVLLLCCGGAQADMLKALQAYEQKDYSAAKQFFTELVPLRNGQAAFNLGAMAYQAEGQPQDITEALAYFMLAAKLEHEQAKNILNQLTPTASEQQLEAATDQFEQLLQQVVISAVDLERKINEDSPEPLRRVNPAFPKEAAIRGQFGYVALRFLVNEEGKVTAVDTLDAYPHNVFEKSAVTAIKKWRYAATGEKHLMRVKFDYAIGGGLNVSEVEKIVNKHGLWQYAAAGVPHHQLALGTLLSLASIQSLNLYRYDPEILLDAATPDFSIFNSLPRVKANFSGFLGDVLVRVSEDGIITEQIKGEIHEDSQLQSLLGQKLNGNIRNEEYRIVRNKNSRVSDVFVTPSIRTSRIMSGLFWLQEAARNGSVEAQRIVAAFDSEWEEYLLEKQDAEVMAWTGTRLILEGQRDKGLQLLEQAIAKKYAPATEMKKQFM